MDDKPTSVPEPPAPVVAALPEEPGRSARPWWVAVALGILISLPLAWLLSFAALLPFFIGLFFFVLFGLLIGAAMYRVAAPGRPFRPSAIVAGTTLVVVVGWGGSIIKEGRDFPSDMAAEAARRTSYIGDRPVAEFRAEAAAQVRRFLGEHYPPGGTIGYMRWILTSGELKKGDLAAVDRTLSRSPNGWVWAIRVALSIAGLAFGVASQTWLLKMPSEPKPAC